MMESIDDLLAQVKSEYQEQNSAKKSPKLPLVPEKEVKPQLNFASSYKPQSDKPTWLSPAEESLLAEVKAEFEEQDREQEIAREHQEQEEKLKTEQKKQKQRQELTQQAQNWLKALDQNSEEGLWFEEFAYNYPSKLEAAADYLQALQGTHQ
ncbi:salt stress protein, Slr1339 family [Lyngbya aestuarii]|uniref:salt stress protein, Slr1339 family n=1 Tax=Lyngbya aestuarii TaxID=118322 RepID=UPI00403DC62F